MASKPNPSLAREFLLHIAQVQICIHTSVSSVALQDRCIRMIEPPSDKQKQGQPQQPTQQEQQNASSSTTATPTTAVLGSAATQTESTQISHESKEESKHVLSRDAKTVVPQPTSSLPSASLQSLSSVSKETKDPDKKPEVNREDASISQHPQQQPLPSPSTAASSLSHLLKTSDVPKSQQVPISPPSPSITRRHWEEGGKPATTCIVGGKQPPAEEMLTLIVPDLTHGDDSTTPERSPQTDSDWSTSSWGQPTNQQKRTVTTTSKVSTSENLHPEDHPFRDRGNSEGKLTVQFSLSPSPKRDLAHVMEFFQEQEKNLQESFLSLPKNPPKKQRSPSPNTQQKLGLEHLDNLVRLMTQLTSLKDENSRLRKRCDYLESTKSLLQAKKDLNGEGGKGRGGRFPLSTYTLPSARKQQQKLNQPHQHSKQPTKLLQQASLTTSTRPRFSSTDDIDDLEEIESSSDQHPKQKKKTLHKRSFSTGSIEVELLETDISSDNKGGNKYKLVAKSASKQKGKSSKWARVKKVLTGQKLYEDLNTTIKSLREFGRSSHVRYSSHGTHEQHLMASERRSREYQRSDSIPLSHEYQSKNTQQATYSSYQEMEATEALSLTSDIWMGPPDWWEEYEANKECATSASSDVSSVIEVTKMYLGPKPDIMSTSQTTSTSTSSSSSFTTTTSTSFISNKRSPTQESLTIESNVPRRKSSPALSINDDEEDDQSLLELASRAEPIRFLHKSSSCKSAELELPKPSRDGKDSGKRFHKTAWGRVKDIIHTRKGSMSKRKPRKDKCGTLTEPEETSEIDMEALLDESWHHDLFAEGLLSRSTPKSSPMIIRQTQPGRGSEAEVPVLSKSAGATPAVAEMSPPQGTVDMAALLGRSLSDDFNKKMQEWEQIKSKKAPTKRSVDDSEICSLDVSTVSQDVKAIELKDFRGSIPEAASESLVTDDSNTSLDVLGLPSVHSEEMAKKKMSESFSRKMQEWERMKYRRSQGSFREQSPELERKGSKGAKEERQKSTKRSREDKEKEKLDRQREREMQKVEKEQVKLEKEKLRIEKERLRALEREAKLEKLKGRLSQADAEGLAKNPVLSPLAEYKVTSDFAHKIHEWELRKGLSHAVSSSVYLEASKIKSQLKEGMPSDTSNRQEVVRFTFDTEVGGDSQEGDEGAGAAAFPDWESPDDTSPIEKYSETSLDDTSVTAEMRTTANIPTLERANAQLLQQLRKKEIEYQAAQEDVQNLNEKLTSVKEEHISEIARFHQQVKEGVVIEPVKLEMGELEQTIGDVEEKIKVMENFGESIAKSMESAAAGKWQSMEGEESVHKQLVELVAQMRNMLIQASQTEEASQKSSALSNFEALYSQSMKLQVQMNNLRLSHLERNREIMIIKRQLLLQEVNNLVLQADITRREAELYQFQQSKQHSSLRRWNTFSGYRSDRPLPQAQIEMPSTVSQSKTEGAMTKSLSDKDSEMKRFEENQSIPSTKSAPCSPSAKTTNEQELAFLQEGSETIPTSEIEANAYPETAKWKEPRSTMVTEIDRLHGPEVSGKDRTGTKTVVSRSTEHPQQIFISPADVSQNTVKVPIKISTLTEYKTQFDSVPLQQEIEALRKEKAKVEMGSPTLRKQKENVDNTVRPSPHMHHEASVTPSQTIPKQACQGSKPRLQKTAQIIENDFPIAQTVMECLPHSTTTDHTSPTTTQTTTVTSRRVEEDVSQKMTPPSSPTNLCTLPPIADQSRAGSRSPRSPVSKHKQFRRQKEKEEREIKSRDYSAISPRGSPVPGRGKPPLPRQERTCRYSPSSSPSVSDREPRSKSHGDVESVMSSESQNKQLQNVIEKFEKRATICNTEERPIELRKPPSPTLHLPRVGLVNRVRKLKPAAELLEESQKYRSGQSIYATRILPKYLSKEESVQDQQGTKHNKENVTGSYVKSMVHRLSRESTPARSAGSSRTTSNSSLHRTDHPRSQSEFISQIVRKLSSSSGPDSPSSNISPLSDLTNESHIKSLLENKSGSEIPSEPSRIESEKVKRRIQSSPQQLSHERKSCEIAMVLSSSSKTNPTSFSIVSAVSTGTVSTCHETTSTTVSSAIPSNHRSLPALTSPTSSHSKPSLSTIKSANKSKSTGHKKDVSFDIEPDFSSLTSASSVFRSQSDEEDQDSAGSSKRSKDKRKRSENRRLLSSLSPVRKTAGRGRMETVGVLCKQSISFDLGVSAYGTEDLPSKESNLKKKRKPRSWDPSDSLVHEASEHACVGAPATSSSMSTSAIECGDVMTSSLEGEIPPSSPTTEDKKKSKRFLDSAWLQKSKKFFKVSK